MIVPWSAPITEWLFRMLQYTHYPEAKNQKHPINRYWFVYRHKSGLSKLETLRILSNEASLRMLYGEVKRGNVWSYIALAI